MAKLNVQQIGILIITAVMIIGTLGSFAVMMLSSNTQQIQDERLQKLSTEYQAAINKREEKVSSQNAELSKKYLPTLKKYAKRVGKYDRNSITKLNKIDLQKGTGKEIKSDTTVAIYYIGWNPDGNIFDQSIDGGKLKSPFIVEGPKDAPVIAGWQDGLIGMRIGGVRLLEIPSDKAYGEQGSGDKIGPNTPLKFIVYAVEMPKEIPYPEVPEELMTGFNG